MASPVKPRLLVRGSVNIDEFFVVPHIVKSGETLSSTSYSRRAGGKGANQAVSAAKAGASVDLAATLGNDGEWVKDALQDYGVGLDTLDTNVDLPTGRAIIQLSSSTHDNSIVLLQGSNYSPSYPAPSASLLSTYSHLLLQNEIPLASTIAYLSAAYAHPRQRITTIFNPSPMLTTQEIADFPWRDLHWLIVNEGEAKELLEAVGAETSLTEEDLLKSLGDKLGNSDMNAVVTKGEKGVVALWNGEVVSCDAGQVVGEVKDTTGAGDCFTGYFATFLASHPPGTASALEDILKIAVQAAAMCVEKEGAMESVPLVNEVKERMGKRWIERLDR